MGLCCLLRYLWPKERSAHMIKKVGRSVLLERLMSSTVPLESAKSRAWIWIASENSADGYKQLSSNERALFCEKDVFHLLWNSPLPVTGYQEPRVKWHSWYCRTFEEPAGPIPITFHMKSHHLHLVNSTTHHTWLTLPCLMKAWDLSPAVSFSGRSIEQAGIWAPISSSVQQNKVMQLNSEVLVSGILFPHIFISGLKLYILLWTHPGLHEYFYIRHRRIIMLCWWPSHHTCHPEYLGVL